MPRYDLVKHAAEREVVNPEIDISGLNLDRHLLDQIAAHYVNRQAFGLGMSDNPKSICLFFPAVGKAIFSENSEVTVTECWNTDQFEKAVKLALVAHRQFIGSRLVEGMEIYKQLK